MTNGREHILVLLALVALLLGGATEVVARFAPILNQVRGIFG